MKTASLPDKRSRIIFYLCLATLVFWNLPLLINVHSVAVVGAAFELLWLPMIIALFILPILSLLSWIRRRYTTRSIYFYSFLLSVFTLAFLVYRTAKDL